MEGLGALVLVGGKSRRMGVNKANLALGEMSFLERIISQLSGFEAVLLSVGQHSHYGMFECPLVTDIYPDAGPLGGIYSGLVSCRSLHLFVTTCDMPLITHELCDYLSSYLCGQYDAYVVRKRDGQIQPLCAIYAKSALPLMQEQLEARRYKMFDLLSRLRVKVIDLGYTVFPDEIFININTHDDYKSLLRRVQGPPVISICGVKNSGKTTLLRHVIPLLKKEQLKIAAIKHDGHDFVPDVPGTDSFSLRGAGADGIAVYSSERFQIIRNQPNPSLVSMLGTFRDMDLILLEGAKYSSYPKIEIVRSDVSPSPVSDLSTLLAVCTDMELNLYGVRAIAIDDYQAVADLILRYISYAV